MKLIAVKKKWFYFDMYFYWHHFAIGFDIEVRDEQYISVGLGFINVYFWIGRGW